MAHSSTGRSKKGVPPVKRTKLAHPGAWQQLISFEIQPAIKIEADFDNTSDRPERFILPKGLLQVDGQQFAGAISQVAPQSKVVLKNITSEQFTTLLEAMASGDFSLVAINCGLLFAESIADVPLANKFLQKLHESSGDSKLKPPLLTASVDDLVMSLDIAYSKKPMAIQRHLLVALVVHSISYRPAKRTDGKWGRSLDMGNFSAIMNSVVAKPWFPDFAREFAERTIMSEDGNGSTWTFPPLNSFTITTFAETT